MGKLVLISGEYISNSSGMDAIVNATNEYMAYGSGICGAVYSAAGINELTNYCKENMPQRMAPEEVRITPGFGLGDMDIIHVLAPKYYQEEKPINVLLQAYKNMLVWIERKEYKNVLMCSIGTGIHGYKHEDVAEPVISLLLRCCDMVDVNIYFNNINPTVKDIYLKPYLKYNFIDLKKDLFNLNESEMLEYLSKNNLTETNIKEKYKNFCSNRELDEMCLSEKIICLQYCLEIIKATKEQLKPLLESIGD